MAFYKIKKVWKLKDNKVTPENFYNTRRDFLKKLGAGSLFLPSTSFISRPVVLHITRIISRSMLFMIEFIREILIGGVETVVAFTSWDWLDKNPWAELPGLPWTIVAGAAVVLGYKLNGRNLAIFAGLTMIYISAFGQWKPSMQTLSFVMVAAPISFLLGLGFGIWA